MTTRKYAVNVLVEIEPTPNEDILAAQFAAMGADNCRLKQITGQKPIWVGSTIQNNAVCNRYVVECTDEQFTMLILSGMDVREPANV